MIDEPTLELVRDALMTAVTIAAPILVAGVVIGLIISIFQSVTQIQEQTLTMVPKIIAMTIVAVMLLPWIVVRLSDFALHMFRLF
ncbi:MAG: flagellar biosynthetic protein FliQ [Phycisphaerales bacterium]|nr:flagellar biosynthetic protein FliQ [Phycisphaerales bacterium]